MDKQMHLQWVDELSSAFDEERFYAEKCAAFIQHTDAFWQRDTPAGHLTGSAWVVHPDGRQVLLVHHRQLDKWVQPGGHTEPGDRHLLDTARREALEETGVSGLTLLSESVFDLDIHVIPEKTGVPKHLHYDLRFLFQARDAQLNGDAAEVKGLQWVPLERLLRHLDTQQSIRRMAIKSLLLSTS